MDKIDISGKALAEHWTWAARKGLMNSNTANALKAACTQVLGAIEGWETVDVREIDVDEVCRRFQNKRSKDFTPESLETYKRRFALSVKEFLKYAGDPSVWKSPVRSRARRDKKLATSSYSLPSPAMEATPVSAALPAGFMEYPFPLREGCIVQLKLPVDLKLSEVRRLNAYLMALAVDFDSAGPAK